MSRYSSTSPSRDSAWSKVAPPYAIIVAWFALKTCDLLAEVAAGDPRLRPVGVLEGLGEDDLGDLVHRPRVLARQCRPGGRHLLVGEPTHQVGTRGPHRVQDPAPDALIDRLIHDAYMVTLKGKSYRLRDRATGAAPAVQAPGLRPSA
jgi:hypothetical protein